MVSILLADDHQIVRKGLRLLLEAEPDFRVTGEAGDGLETVQLLERLKPDVLLLDLMMPLLNGLEVARKARNVSPATRVIVLSMHSNEGYVVDALRHGAAGYVLKGSTTDELVSAVRTVMTGERYLSPPISERAIETYLLRAQGTMMDIYETLTDREREVLQLSAEGLSNAQIGEHLLIGVRTVETHRANLMHKLGFRSQTELVRYALKRGIIE